MIRMKVRAPADADFNAVFREAAKTCDVLLPDKASRTFVVECQSDAALARLRQLNCRLIEDRQYSPDLA